jgi:hypothetical protein
MFSCSIGDTTFTQERRALKSELAACSIRAWVIWFDLFAWNKTRVMASTLCFRCGERACGTITQIRTSVVNFRLFGWLFCGPSDKWVFIEKTIVVVSELFIGEFQLSMERFRHGESSTPPRHTIVVWPAHDF